MDVSKYADVSATLDFEHALAALPMDQYSLQSPAYVTKVLHAIAVRTDECLTDEGQQPVADKVDWTPPLAQEDRTYGLWSTNYASQFGVALAAGTEPVVLDTLSFGVEFNKAYAGCTESAKNSLMDQLLFAQAPNIDWRIRNEAQKLTAASDQGKRAKATWQDCMEGKGLVLDPDDGRPSAQYSAQGKEAEITAALTEAQCAVDTGAAQQLYDLQAQYEAAFIDAQSAQVQAFDAERAEVERDLDAAIAGT